VALLLCLLRMRQLKEIADPFSLSLSHDSAAEKVFGYDVNQKGYKVIKGCGVIQGDGVSYESLGRILDAVLAGGYSAQNCAFGMGGGLLQKLNRDTMSFATKLSYIVYEDGTTRYVCIIQLGGRETPPPPTHSPSPRSQLVFFFLPYVEMS